MKKLATLILASLFSHAAWSDCSSAPAYEAAECYSRELSSLKKQLNQAYSHLYSQTSAKNELEVAQKAWVNYINKQCNGFTLADAGPSGGQITYGLSCQSELLKSRINYLKSIAKF